MSMNEPGGSESLTPLKRAILEIRTLREQVAALERGRSEPIALIGMGLRFPGGADSPDSFWEMLRSGQDAVGPIPADRWNMADYYDADAQAPGKMYTREGAFLGDLDLFPARFFGISPREAEQMDPQQRMLLQVSWEAFEDAGQPPDKLAGSATGVFVGIANSDYLRLLAADLAEIDLYLATGGALSVAAGRISYLLGLQGPSVALDTACSSSLVAVHLAIQSLRQRECDLALAGGVNLILTPEFNVAFSHAQMMAPDGRCKTFDAAADGYVRGEGCAVVVLKRLSDALADGDRILALIRSSAVNQDGRSGGLTAPNGPAQEAVIRQALANAALAPSEVGYVEAHGTGTALGDPIEVQALGAVYGAGRAPDQPLAIGSVKTNLGHLEAAAGVAGLIKVVLMLQHGEIPPHLHLTTPSPHIPWERLAVQVPTARTPWVSAGRRIAGVSSFGFSGTNAHLIVEEAPPVQKEVPPVQNEAPPVQLEEGEPKSAAQERPQHLFALAAKSDGALRALAARYADHLAAHSGESPADVAYSANTGRAHYGHRLAVITDSLSHLREQLAAFAQSVPADVTTGESVAGAPPEVVFLFTGHGSHYAGMGRELYASQPVFRAAVERCDQLLRPLLDRSLAEILFGEGSLLDNMAYAQPALFALQIALAELWRSWGVQPALVAGHSAGEYAAAVVAGVLSLEDGLRLIAARGRLMQSLPPDGEMVALLIDPERVARAVAPYAAGVAIAAINGPETTVISGRRDAVRAVLADLQLGEDEMRRLAIGVAAHSPLVEPILDEFERIVAEVQLAAPQIGLVSSLTGALVGNEIRQPLYWRRHLREPVRFADVFETLFAQGSAVFVEIGPHPALLGMGQRCRPEAGGVWVPSLRRDRDGWEQMLAGLATLYVSGAEIDWAGFDRPYPRRKVALPTYSWERESYWSPSARPAAQRLLQASGRAAELWPAVVAAARLQVGQGPLDLDIGSYGARWALLDRLALAYIVDALCALGLFRNPSERLHADALIERHGVAPTYRHLLRRWLDDLADEGLLARTDDLFYAERPLPEGEATRLLAEAAPLFVGLAPLLAYVRRCGERLADVLTGRESALATLFPDGSYETVDYIYNEWAVARYFNAIARAAAAGAAQARPGHPLRVLEIGAGTGGTTAALLPALPAERTSYTFTDVSDFFLVRAAERFAAYPFVRYVLLNIEEPPVAQEFAAQSYDLIVAANVLHATKELDATLRHTLELLAPGGALLLYETTRHPRWLGMTTGLIEGWQRFEDGRREDQPLLAAADWEAALRANGFTEVVVLPGEQEPAAVLGQHIILALAPGASVPVPLETLPKTKDAHQLTDVPAPSVPMESTAAALREALEAALPDERIDLLITFVRSTIARVLRLKQPESLRREQPLLDLGFDSLMAIELRNRLRQGLDLPRNLPATLVFDYPTIRAIAGYLDRILQEEQGAAAQNPESAAVAAPLTSPTAPAAAPTSAEDLAALSDEEVEAMLLKKLAQI